MVLGGRWWVGRKPPAAKGRCPLESRLEASSDKNVLFKVDEGKNGDSLAVLGPDAPDDRLGDDARGPGIGMAVMPAASRARATKMARTDSGKGWP